MKIITSFAAPLAVLAAMVSTGCVTSNRGDVYARGQARTAQMTRDAVVVSIRPVTIEGTSGVVGGLAGGILGGVVGNTMGGGSGKNVARVGGALVGAGAGAAAEGALTKKAGFEITVQFADSTQLVVVQEAGGDSFAVGQQVSVINDAMGTHRVRPK